MKNNLLILLSVFLLISCSNEQKAKKSATEYVKKHMKDPSSFKAEDVEVILDTVPFFLDKEMLGYASGFVSALEEYKQTNSSRASNYGNECFTALSEKYEESKKHKPLVDYIVLLKCSGNNSVGARISSKCVVVVDKDNPNEVKGVFDVDEDLINGIIEIKKVKDYDFNLEYDRFNRINTEGMTRVEQYIFSNN